MEPLIGEIRMLAGNNVPDGWALCDGSAVSTSDDDYIQLHSLIGNTYGAPAVGYFRLPDLCGRLVMGVGPSSPLGGKSGEIGVAINEGHMPQHSHPFTASGATATTNVPSAGAYYSVANTGASQNHYGGFIPLGTPGAAARRLNRNVIQATGVQSAHANMMPSLAINYVICFRGVFPDQSGLGPVVTSVTPRSGSPNGTGETSGLQNSVLIAISGYGFGPDSVVRFGAVQAQLAGPISSSQIQVRSPSGAGLVPVTVTSRGITSLVTADCIFKYVPSITSLVPAFGSPLGGTEVRIHGVGLEKVTKVLFGETLAGFQHLSDTEMLAYAPAQTNAAESVHVQVADKENVYSASTPSSEYSYWPSVVSIAPDFGPPVGGATATVVGTNIQPGSVVTFDGTSVPGGTIDGNQIVVTTPPGTGAVKVGILAPGQSKPHGTVTYSYRPNVASVSPKLGPPGTAVTIWGTNFAPPYGVWFGGTGVSPVGTPTATQIQVIAPQGVGQVSVTVSSDGGTSDPSEASLYNFAPQITALSPDGGPVSGNTLVAVSGQAFTQNMVLYFGTNQQSFVLQSSTLLTFYTPKGSGGIQTVAVVLQNAAGTSNTVYFEYGLSVTSIAPTVLPATGGTVTISGAGFASGMTAAFGSQQATNVTIIGPQTATCTAPPGVGDVAVTVTVGGVTSQGKVSLSYVPNISSFTPTQAAADANSVVTIEGSGFVPGGTTVMFGDMEAAFSFAASTNELTAIAPVMGGQQVRIRVRTAGGTSPPATGLFSFTPCVTNLIPNFGPATGGQWILVQGLGLQSTIGIVFGSVAPPDFEPLNDAELKVLTPAGTTGTCNVLVQGPFGTTAPTPSTQFTFGPTVSSIDPIFGAPGGGTQVTINGSGFSTARYALFGELAIARLVAPPTDTQLVCIVPPGTDTVPVAVVTAFGHNRPPSAPNFNYLPTVTSVESALGVNQAQVGAWIKVYATGLRPVPAKGQIKAQLTCGQTVLEVTANNVGNGFAVFQLPSSLTGGVLIQLTNGYGYGTEYVFWVH